MKKRIGIIAMSLAVTCLIGSGCASIHNLATEENIAALDAAYKKWEANKHSDQGDTVGNTPEEVEAAPSVPAGTDAVPFANLAFTYGGFRGSSALLSTPRISSLKVHSNGLSFTYDVDLRSWGYAHGDAGGALACLFVRVNGVWRGGKFDWISSSRSTRDFKNVHGGYGGWKPEDLAACDAYAFVIVSADQKRRSNVVMASK